MGPEARGPLLWERDLSESRDIAQAAVNGPGQILKLQTEIFKGKQLRETTVGKQYVRQLELWIKDAKKKRTEEKKKVKQEKRKKEESPELQQLAEYIAGLENQKASWKKLKFP
jgi:phage-related minor tail protein